ncbi:hypothetical protein K8Z61_04040 [Nocardioides sp. TRM66260-LWL]|uniref:MaoC/PaaZ C-terminal domain-containing protein n=1 Tax=Nocardioides sp. TRM66260-LWL TaxID=2874478 RepID=UPI001CC51885|nr:MaoC/PaaZ C-terminal domain-containing protein [Nocardioides sp. TRM66260-LWL]MBZ5733658.1 hypothetical protein [Nocardioides sp. TRM66260-LWL]
MAVETKTWDGATGASVLLKAALPSLPVVGSLPGVKKASSQGFEGLGYQRPAVRIDRAHVEAYARVCGFPTKDAVPLPYPHMLAFPLHMAIMTDAAFPAPAIGTVHLENSITGHRPILVGEELEVAARVSAPLPHPKGTIFEFSTEVHAGGELVWESVSTYLRRGKGTPDAPSGSSFPDADPTGIVWRLPGDLGRRYAAVSGDANPIHLYPLTAKALGFQRQIAHGMWTMARCVAALENRLPGAVKVDVAFKKPVFLPGAVAFGSRVLDDGFAFSLSSPRSGAPHLAGRTWAL